jgi:hypothetical protein
MWAQRDDFFLTIIHDDLKQRTILIAQPALVTFVPFVFKK